MTNPFTAFAFPTSDSGTVNRTLPDRLSDIYNVKDYGATGDGVTDDWAAIMACLNHGEVILTASGANSGNTIPFAGGVPVAVQLALGTMWAYDLTTPSAILSGAEGRISATTSTSVTLALIAGSVSPGDQIRFRLNIRGLIFFPPGDYYVSQPIDFYQGTTDLDVNNCSCRFLGCLGASIVRGNFADYVFSRFDDGMTRSDSLMALENLTIINTHAVGGGIRMGATQGAAIRNCNITANKGINTVNVDHIVGGSWWGSFELEISCCNLSPGSNVSGSEGMIIASDGPIFNNRIIGYESGMELFGGEGGMVIFGNYIATCGIGIAVSVGPGGLANQATSCDIVGNWFKNNSAAVTGMSGTFVGNRIEGADGQSPGGLNAQYGVHNVTGLMAGNIVTGNYDIAGISITGANSNSQFAIIQGTQVTNGSATGGAKAWDLTFTEAQQAPQFTGCNTRPIFTVSELPTWASPVTGSWSGGTATITLSVLGPTGNLFDYNGGFEIVVSGMTPSGYNGSFTATVVAFNQLSYTISNPGGSGTGGTAIVHGIVNGVPTVLEGDCYDVSDGTNGLAWGALVTNSGTHTTHYKVRFNGTEFTVVGQ